MKFTTNIVLFLGMLLCTPFSSFSQAATLDSTFQGGTPATSVAANPVVTYASLGEFDVTLQVTRGTQTATLVKNNYIRNYVVPGTPVILQGTPPFARALR